MRNNNSTLLHCQTHLYSMIVIFFMIVIVQNSKSKKFNFTKLSQPTKSKLLHNV
jgi:hypothetical protein